MGRTYTYPLASVPVHTHVHEQMGPWVLARVGGECTPMHARPGQPYLGPAGQELAAWYRAAAHRLGSPALNVKDVNEILNYIPTFWHLTVMRNDGCMEGV